MDSSEVLSPTNFLLSREELILLLRLIDAVYVFGLEADPLDNLTEQQQAVGLLYAERALRAKGLAMLNEQGQLKIQRDLLEAVGTCAYPHKSIVTHHFAANALPIPCFFHLRDKSIIAHTISESVLHHLVLLADQQSLLNEILSVCCCETLPETVAIDINLKGEVFSQAHERAMKGEIQAAVDVLTVNKVNEVSAEIVSKMLSSSHNVSVIHILTPLPENSLAKRELTILHNTETAWLMVQSETDATNSTFTLQPITTDKFKTLLEDILSGEI